MSTIRLLPFASASGAGNMARDEALLHTASEQGIATLRFYTWDEPTLSLGYFQPGGDRHSGPLSRLAYVRRSTGGAAIVHDPPHEITYSLALPPGSQWQPSGESWLCRMHYFIRDVLAGWGVASKAVVCGEEQKLGPVLCFLHQTPGDLVVTGLPRAGERATTSSQKIAGSAQRKWKGALLQHGSILLSRSPHAPALPGIAELTGVSVDRKQLAAAVVEHFAAQTSWTVVPGDWTAEELVRADSIAAEKYLTAEWNEKR